MQWEGQSAWVQVSASNEELQKMFAERERTAECRQKDTVSERLRRWTRILLGSARRGSNTLGVDCRVERRRGKIVGG